jgi:hypothetical protein
MASSQPAMKMPELLVFGKLLAYGFIGAEIWRVAFYLGVNFALTLSETAPWMKVGAILFGLALCLIYAVKRGAHFTALRIGRSLRFDLLVAVGVGIWTNELVSPWLLKAHAALKSADPRWAPTVLFLLGTALASPLVQQFRSKLKRATLQLYFITDKEIR